MENGIRFLFGGVAGCIGVRDERVFEFMLHGLVTAFCDNNGFGEAVLGAAAVGMNKELDEAEASLQRGSAIAKGALDAMPEAEVPVHERDNANTHDALARRAAFALPEKNAEVEDGNDDVEERLGDFTVGELYELRVGDLVDIRQFDRVDNGGAERFAVGIRPRFRGRRLWSRMTCW